MKKRNYPLAALYLCMGLLCLYGAIRLGASSVTGILYGLAGALIGGGAVLLAKTWYWRRPENRARYEELADLAAIEQEDELKMKLRDKAGRQAYLWGLLVSCVAVLIFSILNSTGVLPGHPIYILYLAGYLIFQVIIGIILFNHLLKKYE